MPSEQAATWTSLSVKPTNALWPLSASERNGSTTTSNAILTNGGSGGVVATSIAPDTLLLGLDPSDTSPVPRSERRGGLDPHLNISSNVWGPLLAVLPPLAPVVWHTPVAEEPPKVPRKRGRPRKIRRESANINNLSNTGVKRHKPVGLKPHNNTPSELPLSSAIYTRLSPGVSDGSTKLQDSYTDSLLISAQLHDLEVFSEPERKSTSSRFELTDDSDIQEPSSVYGSSTSSTNKAIILSHQSSKDSFDVSTFVKDPEKEAKINRFVSRRGLVEYFRVRFQDKISKREMAELILYLGYRDLLVHYEHKNVKELLKLLYQEVSVSSIHRIDPRNETISDLKYCLQNSKRILVITGAGISTSLNIPDFRSPNGLYPMLAHQLANPADVFTLKHFKQNPELFYSVAYRTLPPENVSVSLTHSFIKLLQDKGVLLRDYTQNIDNLEIKAGLHRDNLVQCHGSYDGAHCIKCNHRYPGEYVFPYIRNKQVPICKYCNSDANDNVIKPDITFFGEALPRAYSSQSTSDFSSCDLLIVIGTSLQVAPISKAIHKIPARIPKVLINRELVPYDGFNYHLLGDCDDIVNYIANLMGWNINSALASITSCNIKKDNSGKNVYRFGS